MDEHGPHLNHLNLSQYYYAIVDVHFGPGRKLQSARLVMFLDWGIPGYHPGMLNSQMSVSDVLYILSMKRWTMYPTFSLNCLLKATKSDSQQCTAQTLPWLLRVEQKEMSKSRPINNWNSRLGTVGRWPLQPLQILPWSEGRKVDQLQCHPGESWLSTHAKAISEFRGQGAQQPDLVPSRLSLHIRQWGM